jgi:hypothetical protein
MSNRFFDVLPNHWFYKDLRELENIIDDDSKQFVTGIPFNKFETGKEGIDKGYPVLSATNVLVLDIAFDSTQENPVTTYVDGIVTNCSVVKNKPVEGKTTITFQRKLILGQYIRVVRKGTPKLTDVGYWSEELGKPDANVGKLPFSYPHVQFVGTEDSLFGSFTDPTDPYFVERVTRNGSELKKIDYPTTNINDDMFFFKSDNEYTVSPQGKVYVPFSLNLENITMKFSYFNNFDAISVGSMTARAEIDPTENLLYFGYFPNGRTSRAELFTLLNNLRIYLTRRYSSVDPFKNDSKTTSRFPTVQSKLVGTVGTPSEPWYWKHVKVIEDLKLPNGDYIIPQDDDLDLDIALRRKEAIVYIENFRVWFIESFK